MHTTVTRVSRLTMIAAAAITLAIVCLGFNTGTAQAMYQQNEVAKFKSGTHYVMLDPTGGEGNVWAVYDPDYNEKMTIAKSSKKSVAAVKYASKSGFNILFKKPGKATITYKYKGKKYTHKFVVLKYTNPAKSLKIGSKNYATKFKKKSYLELGGSYAGKKLVATPVAGWKVKDVIVMNLTSEKHKKSGYKITKSDNYISVIWENKKNHALVATAMLLKDQGQVRQ